MARTVLFVDDSPSMRSLVHATLKNAGFHVIEAENGQLALEAADRNSAIELVITDINMPVMDGITFVQQLRSRSNFRYTPVLLLTTESSGDQKKKAKAVGATGWVTKPFDPPRLVATVQRVLP